MSSKVNVSKGNLINYTIINYEVMVPQAVGMVTWDDLYL